VASLLGPEIFSRLAAFGDTRSTYGDGPSAAIFSEPK
jgi:hypothetical protein